MTRTSLFLLAALSLLGPSIALAGGGGEFSMTLESSKDNTLYESLTGALSNGAGEYLFVGRTGQKADGIRRAVVAFDISLIPQDATVVTATLELGMDMTVSGAEDVELRALTADWGEGTSIATGGNGGQGAGGASTTDDATWIHTFFDSSSWSTEGGDFSGVVSATTSVSGPGTYAWGSNASTVADVQAWIDVPSSNFGWILLGDEAGAGSAKRFGSREQFNADARPRLTVTFDSASTIFLDGFETGDTSRWSSAVP